MAEQRYFEDIDVGDEFTEEQQPTREHVEQFFNISRLDGRPSRAEAGDGRFTSTESARELGLERPIVPGTMSMAMITRLVTDWMGPRGQLQFIDVSFRRPVQHDDRLQSQGLVTDTTEEDGRGVLKLDIYLENERGERPLQGTAAVELPRRG